MWILLILVVGLIGFAVALGVSAALQPRIRRAREPHADRGVRLRGQA